MTKNDDENDDENDDDDRKCEMGLRACSPEHLLERKK